MPVGASSGCHVVVDVSFFRQDRRMKQTRRDPIAVYLRAVAALTVAWPAVWMVTAPLAHAADDKPVYKCPGNLYTDALTPREAQDKGCRTLDGAPVTVIQSNVPRPAGGTGAAAGRPAGAGDRVGADDQKARDADARLILEAELRKEEEALANLQKEYNGGQPERRGDERNYQKYLDRLNELKAAITRKESDIASLRRELGKFGGGK